MKAVVLILFVISPLVASSQVLLEESVLRLKISSGKNVTLYAGQQCPQCFYYVPSALELSKKGGGVPEISLLTWQKDGASRHAGGILHFLIEWGLSPSEEQEVTERVRALRDSAAMIAGAAVVYAARPVTITGKDKLVELLKSGLTSVPLTATTPGSKMAFSFRFDEDAIAELISMARNPSRIDGSIEAAYGYEALAASGNQERKTITIGIPLKDIFNAINKIP